MMMMSRLSGTLEVSEGEPRMAVKVNSKGNEG